ncbi:hypothetical protein ACHAXR_009647 [Thalassiosira sp. AJA248-18]
MKTSKTAFVHIRIFSHPQNNNEHSFYVGHEAGGLSERVETLAVNPSSSFLQIRELIEEQSDGNIIRRRPFYTDFLHFIQRCPNPLGYEGEAVTTYRIGILKMKDDKGFVPSLRDIKVIKEDVEAGPACEIVDELLGTDIVLIPTTQIHPTTGRLSDQI